MMPVQVYALAEEQTCHQLLNDIAMTVYVY